PRPRAKTAAIIQPPASPSLSQELTGEENKTASNCVEEKQVKPRFCRAPADTLKGLQGRQSNGIQRGGKDRAAVAVGEQAAFGADAARRCQWRGQRDCGGDAGERREYLRADEVLSLGRGRVRAFEDAADYYQPRPTAKVS